MGRPFIIVPDMSERVDALDSVRLGEWYDRLRTLSGTLNLEVDDIPKVTPDDCVWNGFPRIALHDRFETCANCMYRRVCGNCYWGICLRNDLETREFAPPRILYFASAA